MIETALRRTLGVCLASAIAFATGQASATTVTFSNITGTWFNAKLTDGTPITNITGSGTGSTQIRWGGDAGFGQSGYNFDAVSIPSLTVNPPGGSAAVAIAQFEHVNLPIFPPSAKSLNLAFSTDVAIDGNPYGNVTFLYHFRHDETTNNLDPCPYDGANGQGLNINGCADHVDVNFNSKSDSIVIDGLNYTLGVEGFLIGGIPTSGFTTIERQVNTAYILGRLELFSAAVPEPSSWAMLIAGFGLVGAAARRRVTVAA